jgi:hypothetical protein
LIASNFRNITVTTLIITHLQKKRTYEEKESEGGAYLGRIWIGVSVEIRFRQLSSKSFVKEVEEIGQGELVMRLQTHETAHHSKEHGCPVSQGEEILAETIQVAHHQFKVLDSRGKLRTQDYIHVSGCALPLL